MSTQEITPGSVIAKYLETRDIIKAKEKALDEELAQLKQFQKNRENWLRSEMERQGVTSFKLKDVGTCFTKRTESVKVDDWDAVLEYAMTNDRLDILTKGVSKTAVLEIMGDERDKPLPPGVSYVSFADINIRKS